MSEHPPELVEKVARAMFMARYVTGDRDTFNRDLWERTSEMMREDCRKDARAALDAITETHAVVDKSVIARALAYGDAFRTPAAAGARAALRESAGMEPPNARERLQPRITAKPPHRGTEAPD